MGTNYYIKKRDSERKINEPDIHIGKNSYGWEFSFQSIPELGLTSYQKWIEFIFMNSERIYNEYNENISFEDMLKVFKDNCPGSKMYNSEKLNKNHHNELKEDKTHYSSKTFVDAEGWSFSEYDFC